MLYEKSLFLFRAIDRIGEWRLCSSRKFLLDNNTSAISEATRDAVFNYFDIDIPENYSPLYYKFTSLGFDCADIIFDFERDLNIIRLSLFI